MHRLSGAHVASGPQDVHIAGMQHVAGQSRPEVPAASLAIIKPLKQ